MTYTIERNAEFGSLEVYFSDNPSQMIRDALKLLRFRWHGLKKCWYGFAEESTLRDTLCNASGDDNGTILTDGYLGATAVYGTKSNRRLYGAELSAAIRAEFKAAGLKGVTISCKRYSGGHSLTITVKSSAKDFVPRDEFMRSYEPRPVCEWIYLADNDCIRADRYYTADPDDDRENLRRAAAAYAYDSSISRNHGINQYYIDADHYPEYTAAMLDRLRQINSIVSAYRYNDSNGMVDYFETNFYYTITVKAANA